MDLDFSWRCTARAKNARDTQDTFQSHTKKPPNHYQEGGQALAQDAQREGAISTLGDVQDLPGHSLEQSGVVRPVLNRLEVPSNLNDGSMILIIAWYLFAQR